MTRFVEVAHAIDIPKGEVRVVELEGRSFCVAHLEDGSWSAIDNVCSHDGGPLGEGFLDGDCVECPRHGSLFDVHTGAAKTLPAVFPVNAYPVREADGKVEVDLGVEAKEVEIG